MHLDYLQGLADGRIRILDFTLSDDRGAFFEDGAGRLARGPGKTSTHSWQQPVPLLGNHCLGSQLSPLIAIWA